MGEEVDTICLQIISSKWEKLGENGVLFMELRAMNGALA